MSQRLATYSRAYSTRSCRQQCFYGNASIGSTENVLADISAVSGDGHEVAQDFTINYDDTSRRNNYKFLQQQIIGHNIQPVEDIEKWLRYTSEHISNQALNEKNNSQVDLERSLSEQLSGVFDKELLTDIELTAKQLNIDYDAVLTGYQIQKILPAKEKNHEFLLPDLRLNNLVPTQENSTESESSNACMQLKNSTDNSSKIICSNVKESAEAVQRKITEKKHFKNNKTDLINNVNRDSFDATLTMSIQDLSVENDSSDGSSDTNNCTNSENVPNSNKSENSKPLVVIQENLLTKKYNTRSKSTKSPNVKSKIETSMVKRKRKVNNQENTLETEKNNTFSGSNLLHEKSSNKDESTPVKKSPRISTSESSGSESDDLCKGKNPLFVSNQELIIAKALEEVGITESTLEYFYTGQKVKTWRCHLPNCCRHFAKLFYLKAHLMGHFNIKPFKCNYSGCSWAFYTDFKLKRHQKTHLNNKDYVCQVPGCQRRFTTIYTLASHEKTHERPNKIACQVEGCSANFPTKRALGKHMKCHDESLAPYVCDYEGCGKRFYSNNVLVSHRRCHNYSDKDLTCSWPGCGKTFDHPCRKKLHMRSHTGQKPYTCTVEGCDMAFPTAGQLNRHQRSHVNGRTFICDEEGCNKVFMRSTHLRDHKLAHEEGIYFTCHYCATSFDTKRSLYVHIKSHLKNNYVPEEKKYVEETTCLTSSRGKKIFVASSESESASAEETENNSLAANCAEISSANVLIQKMYKCPVEYCTKWYSHRSSLRVHLRKHTSPLSETQNVNEDNLEESTVESTSCSNSSGGAARTEFTCEYVLSLKSDRQVIGSNEVGTVELTEGLLRNENLPSVYSQVDVDLPDYQLPVDTDYIVDVMQALE